jgi:uroporphyrinogen decarboxylase
MSSLLLRTLRGKKAQHPPIWFMRQAGRYLPEYRKIRASAKSFLTLCYTPELAAEVTLQPVRRFDMDAAILFSDILVVPHAMGAEVDFVEGEGPRITPVRDEQSIQALQVNTRGHLAPVGETVKRVRAELAENKALIGFCGGPWTVACYMVEGRGSKNWEDVRKFAIGERALFSRLIQKLVQASADYLTMQIEAGANAVQIFDSWAGVLPENEYRSWVIEPTRTLVNTVRAKFPHIPIIGFPRGSGVLYTAYANETGVDAVGIDTQTPLAWALGSIPKILQGNLDPLLLAMDKEKAVGETKRILEVMRGKPFVFNLGHGILPQTPIENVMAVCEMIKADVP